MNNYVQLPELDDAIIRYVQDHGSTYERIVDSFVSKTYSQEKVAEVIDELINLRSYIRRSKSRYLKTGVYLLDSPTDDDDFEYRYKITALGKAYLARSTANFTSFSNINNSNIANQSANLTQSIYLSDLSTDLQSKILELEKAILIKDKNAIMTAFGYLADKSIDVAIAVITGNIIKS